MPDESKPDLAALDSGWEDDEGAEADSALDELDAGWDVEEERAVAADVAAGLDAGARRKAAEERAAARKERLRAKKLAAKEKRRARSDSIRQKQKKPKRRSTVPPRQAVSASRPAEREPEEANPVARDASRSGSEERKAGPKRRGPPRSAWVRRWDSIRIVMLVGAVLVAVGAVAMTLLRR